MSSTPPAPAENATIRQMREQIDAEAQARKDAEAQLKDVKEKLTAKEREELAENDRLKAELADAQQKLATSSNLEAQLAEANLTFQETYDGLLASAPDEAKETLKQLSQNGPWPERLRQLKAGMKLANIATPVVQVGSSTQPTAVTPPTPPSSGVPAVTEQALPGNRIPSWNEAFKRPATPG